MKVVNSLFKMLENGKKMTVFQFPFHCCQPLLHTDGALRQGISHDLHSSQILPDFRESTPTYCFPLRLELLT